MLNKVKIEEIVLNHLEGSDKFLVDIEISSTNVIDVYVDGDNGISIGECVQVSRLIESAFDRDEEDYELRVSSPGLDSPFKLLRQYKKYVGREIRISLNDGQKLKATLLSVDDEGIKVEYKADKKAKTKTQADFKFEEIKTVKPEISFK
ncbi:MAG: ribosome assembly cofactor RimP [Bacteroidales bacterium]|nr:ribosome assembly cofactor RimP [Bacteroidales bacterium]